MDLLCGKGRSQRNSSVIYDRGKCKTKGDEMAEILLLILPGIGAALCHCRLSGSKNHKVFFLWLSYGCSISLILYLLKGLLSDESIKKIGENFTSVQDFFLYGATAILLSAVLPVSYAYWQTSLNAHEKKAKAIPPSRHHDGALSTIRLAAIILVVFCHIFEQVGSILGIKFISVLGNYCSVGVPMFLLLSGYLYGQKEYEGTPKRANIVIRGLKKVLLDYYIYAFLFIVPLYYFLVPESISFQAVIYTLLGRFHFPQLVHFWYIPYALLCYLVTPFLYDIKKILIKVSKNRLSIFMSLTLLMLVVITLLSHVYKWYFLPVYLWCYIIGFFLPDILRWWQDIFNMKHLFIYITPFCLAFNGCKIYLKNIAAVKWDGLEGTALTLLYDISHLLLGLWLFTAIYLAYHFMEKHNIVTSGSWILKMSDKYSFDIYIVHMLYIKGVLSVMRLSDSYILNILFALFLSILSAVILRWICGHVSAVIKSFSVS